MLALDLYLRIEKRRKDSKEQADETRPDGLFDFDDVTDRCDKEACPPVNCASPYIPLGECCPVCPPQEVVYEERRGSTSAQGRPGAPGPDGRPGAPGPPGPQPDLGPFMGQIEQQAGEKGPSPDPFSYMQAQVGPVGPRGSPGEISQYFSP